MTALNKSKPQLRGGVRRLGDIAHVAGVRYTDEQRWLRLQTALSQSALRGRLRNPICEIGLRGGLRSPI